MNSSLTTLTKMSEQSIASARASVMVYDDVNKKWVPSGSSSGLSKVHIYQHLANNTFRVVGRKLQDHEVVINCSIPKGLKYNQATATFHQWRDGKQVFGLNFSSRDDAEAFAIAMIRTLEIVNQNNTSSRPSPHSVGQPLYQSIPGDIETNHIDQQKWVENDGRPSHPIQYASSAVLAPPANGPSSLSSGGSPNSNSGHRSLAPPNCAPPAPPAPPMPINTGTAAPPPPPPPPPPLPGPGVSPCPPPFPNQGPPPPPAPPMSSMSNPPCPPPPPNPSMLGSSPSPMSLASAIANAKLKKTPRISEGSNDSVKSCGPPQPNMASMMDEMAKTLARRRAQAESSQNSQDMDSLPDKKAWEKQNATNGNNSYIGSSGPESPKSNRRQRIGSISDLDAVRSNGVESCDMDRLKQEIMVEIRMEISKLKNDIIDAIRMELNRR